MRNSSVEIVIIDVLQQHKQHLSANQVFDEIRDRLPAVNPSTVYRALDRLAKTGKISVSDMGTGSFLYELVECCGQHHHLVCQKCGEVETLSVESVQVFFNQVAQMNGFQVTTNHLVLFGYCEPCQAENRGQVLDKT